MKPRLCLLTLAISFAWIMSEQAAAQNYYPYVVARPADRATLQNTPIHLRPNRPFHFYGNAVRRVYGQNPAYYAPPAYSAAVQYPYAAASPYAGQPAVSLVVPATPYFYGR